MDPLHATFEEFAADGFTQIECHCPRCRVTRLRPISWLPIFGPYRRAALSTAALCSAALGQALAIVRRARQAVRTQRLSGSINRPRQCL